MLRVDFACPLLDAVDGRVAEDGLLETVVGFDVLGVAVFGGLGVSFKDRGGSFTVPFGVVGVSGAFSLLLLDREVTAGTLALCRDNFFGVPNVSPSKITPCNEPTTILLYVYNHACAHLLRLDGCCQWTLPIYQLLLA